MPGPRIDYIAALGQQRCQELANQCRQDRCVVSTDTNYWLASGSKNQDGYVQIYVSLPGRKKARGFLLHIVAAAGRFGASPTTGWQVSHLCDRRSCFNPSHLAIETVQENNARKGCVGDLYCSVHVDELICPLCLHSPKCIRPPRADVVCCLARRRSEETAAAAADDSGLGSSGASHYDGEEELEEAVALGTL